MFQQIKIGFSAYVKAGKFIRENKLSWVYLVPFVSVIFLFTVTISGSGILSNELANWVIEVMGIGKGGAYYNVVGAVIGWIFYLVIKVISWFLLQFIIGSIMLVLLSPLLAYLSEKTEQILKGSEYPFNFTLFVKDVYRGIIIAVRNAIVQTILMLLLLLFSLIPIIGWTAPLFMFVIGAYYYGFSFLDYTCERRRLTRKESVRFMRKNKGLVISNGAIFSIAIMIPWIGSIIASFVAINSVVAATLSVYSAEEKKLLK